MLVLDKDVQEVHEAYTCLNCANDVLEIRKEEDRSWLGKTIMHRGRTDAHKNYFTRISRI